MVYLNLTIYLFKMTSDEMQLIYYVGCIVAQLLALLLYVCFCFCCFHFLPETENRYTLPLIKLY